MGFASQASSSASVSLIDFPGLLRQGRRRVPSNPVTPGGQRLLGLARRQVVSLGIAVAQRRDGKVVMSSTPFRSATDRIFRDAMPWLENSAQHSGVDGRLEGLLLLADRLLASFEGCNVPDLHRLHERFSGDPYFGHVEGAVSDPDTMLTMLLEPFLRGVLFRADPVRHEALQAGRAARNNLHALLRELGLAGDHVLALPLEHELQIEDFAVRAAFHAKETRNAATHRAPRRSGSQVALNQETFVATLVAALDLHRGALLHGLMGLVPHTLERNARLALGDHECERQGHLRRFVGRAGFLESLELHLADAARDSGYVLLLGGEGGGKSAVVAALTQRLAERASLMGAGAGGARQSFPWIGGSLLFFGKQNARARDILESLIEQARLCLVDPPPRNAPETNLEFSFKQHLRALQCERGRLIVVIDALDEVDDDLVKLLPASAPKEVVFLLTCRHEHDAVRRLRERLRPTVLTLPALDDADARALIAGAGITDEAWASKALRAAGGLPLHLVQAAADPTGDPNASVQDLLRRKQARWRAVAPGEPDVVREALFVLALFEPVSMLKLSEVAACLRSRGHDGLTGPGLRDRLTATRGVSEDVTSLEERSLKLSNKPFAEYVREFVVEGGDLAALVESCARWLTRDPDVDLTLASRFIAYWADARRPAGCARAARKAVREAEARGDAPCLRGLFDAGASRLEAPPILVECLEAAIRLGDAEAKAELGGRLLEGRGMAQDLPRAVELLQAASIAGVTGAGVTLANRALSDTRLGISPEDALWILEQAHAVADASATSALATALLQGSGTGTDPARAGAVLRQGVARGDAGIAADLVFLLDSGVVAPEDDAELARVMTLVRSDPDAMIGRWLQSAWVSAVFEGLLDNAVSMPEELQDLVDELASTGGRDQAGGALILALAELRHSPNSSSDAVRHLREALRDPNLQAASQAVLIAHGVPALRAEVMEVATSLAEHGDLLARRLLCAEVFGEDARVLTRRERSALASLESRGYPEAALALCLLRAKEAGDRDAIALATCDYLGWGLQQPLLVQQRVAMTIRLARQLDISSTEGAIQIAERIAAMPSMEPAERAFVLLFDGSGIAGIAGLRPWLTSKPCERMLWLAYRFVARATGARGLSVDVAESVLQAAQESGVTSAEACTLFALRSLTRAGLLGEGPWNSEEIVRSAGPCLYVELCVEAGRFAWFWEPARQDRRRSSIQALASACSPEDAVGSELVFLVAWRKYLCEQIPASDTPAGREVTSVAFAVMSLVSD